MCPANYHAHVYVIINTMIWAWIKDLSDKNLGKTPYVQKYGIDNFKVNAGDVQL